MFIIFKNDYALAIGGWVQVDMITVLLNGTVGYISDLISGFVMLKDRVLFQDFHRRLVHFVVNMVRKTSHVARTRQVENFESRRKWLERAIKIITFLGVSGYGLLLVLAGLLGVFFGELLDAWVLATIPFVTYCLIPVHVFRLAQVFVVSGILSYILFGLKALRCQIEQQQVTRGKCQKLNAILDSWKEATQLIQEFNELFQWLQTCGMLTILVSMLCMFYQFCSWYVANGIFAAIPALPALFTTMMTLWSICYVASEIGQEGKLCIGALRDVGAYGWVLDDVGLSRKVKLCHAAGAFECPKISPGYFFTLELRLISSVS